MSVPLMPPWLVAQASQCVENVAVDYGDDFGQDFLSNFCDVD